MHTWASLNLYKLLQKTHFSPNYLKNYEYLSDLASSNLYKKAEAIKPWMSMDGAANKIFQLNS